MAAIKILIVDDEPLARERIRALLSSHPDVEIVGECATGIEAIEAILRLGPDLVFLDVQMPDLDGLGVIEQVGVTDMPTVIFVTAYDTYALRAFDVNALDYLLKPFDRERFETALSRARAQIRQKKSGALNQKLLALIADIRTEPARIDRLVIKSGGRVFFIRTDEIDWIEAAGNYVRLHTATGEHLHRETMSNLEARLDPKKFMRIHRSVIVNCERIKELHPLFHGEYEVTLEDGTRLTLSRSYRDRLQEFLGKQI
ncbi:MAG: LytTR family DNA-binding domain-containing protein [Acidobacteriota bacterium]